MTNNRFTGDSAKPLRESVEEANARLFREGRNDIRWSIFNGVWKLEFTAAPVGNLGR